MKKPFLALAVLVLIAGIAFLVAPARAQDQDTTSQASTTQPRSPEKTVELLASKLNLTDDQKAQITPIIAERQQKLRELQGESGRRMKKARKAKGILENSEKKINAVLTDEQKKKYAELKQELREERKERRQSKDK